jgi:ABC-type proline/glycine betaine transport system ATPase subunit
MIGISLLSNSEIVLLDEFSNFLDPISRSRVHRLLKSLLHTRTIVMASHMAEEIESLSDDIAIMSKGSLITVGSKAMLKAGDHHYNDRSSVQQDSLVYTVNIRVESVQVLMSVQSFVISTLARIPPPKLAQTTTTTTNPNLDLAALHKTESQQYIHMWHSWLKQCADGGVKLVDQRHNRFTLHVSTDLFPLSTLFTRLEGCKMQCGTHLLRYTASQPTVDQLFISVLERSNRITKNSDDKMDYGGSVVI